MVVARCQVYIRLLSRVSYKVTKLRRLSRVKPVLSIIAPVPPSPSVPSIPITRAVLLHHVEPQALHGVTVQDVCKLKGVSQLCSMGEVSAVAPAVCPGHHDSVGASKGAPPTLSTPVCRS